MVLLLIKKSCFKYLYKNQTLINPKFFKVLSKFNKKINLIVVLESNFINNIIKESYIASIPTIFIAPSLEIENYKISYKIPGSFNFLKRKNKYDFFFLSWFCCRFRFVCVCFPHHQ